MHTTSLNNYFEGLIGQKLDSYTRIDILKNRLHEEEIRLKQIEFEIKAFEDKYTGGYIDYGKI